MLLLVPVATRRNFSVREHYMLSPVCPSVTWVDQSKTDEVRIMKFSPYDSPIPLVFEGEVSSRNSKGFPSGGVKQGRGG